MKIVQIIQEKFICFQLNEILKIGFKLSVKNLKFELGRKSIVTIGKANLY
jgi:hypothetical protein